jgi:hypothetical protein
MAAEPTPFFSTARGTGGDRLLLVGYHFPPDPAVGGLRWQKLADLIAERGWGLDVLTQDPGTLKARDDARLAELPSGVRVFGVTPRRLLVAQVEHALWSWYRAARPATPTRPDGADTGRTASAPRKVSILRTDVRWLPREPRDLVRAYFGWMDFAWSGVWAGRAAATGIALTRGRGALAVISSGPPHFATHEAARRIARRTGVPFVMDLRDPWSRMTDLPEGMASPVWWHLAERHEARAVASAALVVTNTAQHLAALQRLYPDQRDRMIAVFNGYDEEPLPTGRRGRRFTIAYAGTIYMTRDPRPLLRAVARLVADRRLSADDVGVDFMGHVQEFEGRSVQSIAAEEGVADLVRVFPPRPRRDALQFQADAHVLVSLPQDSTLTIPAKIFEYARFPAWVLALGGPESASANLVRELRGDAVSYGDPDGIAAVLARRYAQHVAGETPRPLAADAPQYSRRAQGQRLLDAIASLAERASRNRPR